MAAIAERKCFLCTFSLFFNYVVLSGGHCFNHICHNNHLNISKVSLKLSKIKIAICLIVLISLILIQCLDVLKVFEIQVFKSNKSKTILLIKIGDTLYLLKSVFLVANSLVNSSNQIKNLLDINEILFGSYNKYGVEIYKKHKLIAETRNSVLKIVACIISIVLYLTIHFAIYFTVHFLYIFLTIYFDIYFGTYFPYIFQFDIILNLRKLLMDLFCFYIDTVVILKIVIESAICKKIFDSMKSYLKSAMRSNRNKEMELIKIRKFYVEFLQVYLRTYSMLSNLVMCWILLATCILVLYICVSLSQFLEERDMGFGLKLQFRNFCTVFVIVLLVSKLEYFARIVSICFVIDFKL